MVWTYEKKTKMENKRMRFMVCLSAVMIKLEAKIEEISMKYVSLPHRMD